MNDISDTPSTTSTPMSDTTAHTTETIIENHGQMKHQSAALQQSTNSNNRNDSLTNSQISMISNGANSSHLYQTPDTHKNKLEVRIKDPDAPTVGKRVHMSMPESTEMSDMPTQRSAPFPETVWLGLFQLLLAIMLAAMGGLVLARGAALSNIGAGIWAGGIGGLAGALGMVNVKKCRTGFLAVSLICVASSTLGMAITGIGMVRDVNFLQKAEDSKGVVSAGAGLMVALAIHLLVSVCSVYYSALQLCSKECNNQMIENAIVGNNSVIMTHQKVEDYIKSMTTIDRKNPKSFRLPNGELLSQEQMMQLWMSQQNPHGMAPPQIQQMQRPIILVPAGVGNGMMPMYGPPPHPPHTMMYPPNMLPPGVAPMSFPIQCIQEMETLQRIRSSRSTKERKAKRRRRTSDSELENRKAFTYTGLDRDIADSFLERQEKVNGGSSIDSMCSTKGGDVAM